METVTAMAMAMETATATGLTAMAAAMETGMPITAMETARSSRDELLKAVGWRT